MAKNPHSGSLFTDYLKEQGTYEQTTATAVKRVLARQLEKEMKRRHLSKAKMAMKMKTSRTQLDRLLDPEITAITLDTLQRAASAVGRELRLELV